MINFTQQGKKKKTLVVFVHGLTGDSGTWINDNGKSFGELLTSNPEIKKKCDTAEFSYFSQLFPATRVRQGSNFISKMFGGLPKKVEFNLDINSLSDLLTTELKVKCSNYESIILIGHSMGGLICKDAILKASVDTNIPTIKLFISLAVPHDGSHLAQIAKNISASIQLKNLAPLNETIKSLNNSWIQSQPLPDTVYIQGKYDTIVSGTSSVSYQATKQEVLFVEEDHSSIAKPSSKKSTVFASVQKIILDFLMGLGIADALTLKKLKDESSYNDEIFVLKLMIADVHNKNISSAKNCFYNAEFIKKIIIAKRIMTLAEFKHLYSLIEGMYNNAFGLLTSGKLHNGNDLVAYIHAEIQKEDQNILKSISALSFIHKTGMLHQLSNDLQNEIWWSEGHTVEKINEFKNQKGE